MPTDNARNQQAFRDRIKQDGGARVEFTLNKDLLQAVELVRQSLGAGCTRQDALTHLLNQGASTVKTNQYRADHAQRGQAGLSAADEIELQKFKNQLINDHLDARELQANGGPAGVAHKARINAMLDANNQHRQK